MFHRALPYIQAYHGSGSSPRAKFLAIRLDHGGMSGSNHGILESPPWCIRYGIIGSSLDIGALFDNLAVGLVDAIRFSCFLFHTLWTYDFALVLSMSPWHDVTTPETGNAIDKTAQVTVAIAEPRVSRLVLQLIPNQV